MRVYGTDNKIFFISKHVTFLGNGYTKGTKGIPQINNLPHKSTGRNKLKTIVGCLHSTMFLILTIHWIFVDQIKYNSNTEVLVRHQEENHWHLPTHSIYYQTSDMVMMSNNAPLSVP